MDLNARLQRLARLRSDVSGALAEGDAFVAQADHPDVRAAVNRGAVHRLYPREAFTASGCACPTCQVLQSGATASCRVCGATAKSLELGEAMVDRVLASGGTVDTVAVDQALEHAGGVAAWLRYPM